MKRTGQLVLAVFLGVFLLSCGRVQTLPPRQLGEAPEAGEPGPKKAPPVKGEEKKPAQRATGVVTGSRVNVRAGPNLNYEILIQVEEGQRLRVVSTEPSADYTWHEVLLPAGTSAWISSEYVKLEKGTGFPLAGEVTGNAVSVRARGGLKHSVLCALNRGDLVRALDMKTGWYRIEAPPECTGWISGDYLQVEE